MNRPLVYLVVLFTLFFYGCTYQKKTVELLKNNTLLYCVRDAKAIYRPLYHIVEMRGDSIYEAGSRSHTLQEWYNFKKSSPDNEYLYVPFQLPYTLKRKGKRIVLFYKNIHTRLNKLRIYSEDQYLLKRIDSTKCTNLNYLCNQEMGYSKYLGDTIITVANQKFKCLVFCEYYLRKEFRASARDMTVTRYLEKSTLIPIKIHTEFYEREGFREPAYLENEGYIILTSIVPRDSLRKNLDYKTQYCY